MSQPPTIQKTGALRVIGPGEMPKPVAVALHHSLSGFVAQSASADDAKALMLAYGRAISGFSETLVLEVLADLEWTNPRNPFRFSPMDLRLALEAARDRPLHLFWRRLSVRMNMVSGDIREMLREEVFEALRAVAADLGPTDDEWLALIELGRTGRAVDKDGVLIRADKWASRFRAILRNRHQAEALAAAIAAVRPEIEAEHERDRDEIALMWSLTRMHGGKREVIANCRPAGFPVVIGSVIHRARRLMADGIGSPFGFCIVGGANSVPCSDMEKAAVALVAESLPGDLLGALVLDAANELLPEWLRFRMTAGDR